MRASNSSRGGSGWVLNRSPEAERMSAPRLPQLAASFCFTAWSDRSASLSEYFARATRILARFSSSGVPMLARVLRSTAFTNSSAWASATFAIRTGFTPEREQELLKLWKNRKATGGPGE